MLSTVWVENRRGRDKEGEAGEVRCMCGGGERRRTGKGNDEKLAMEEDEMGVGDSKSWPPFPGGYGDEIKDGGTHPSARTGIWTQGRNLLSLLSHQIKEIGPSSFLSCLLNLGNVDRPQAWVTSNETISSSSLWNHHFYVMKLLGKESVIKLRGSPHLSTCLCSHSTP